MQNIDAFVIFAKVGELQSISGAARALRLPKANVSRVVVRLEEAYGVNLVERSTRNVKLTEVGRVVHAYSLRIRDEMEEAQAAVAAHKGDPAGTLRIGCPADVARDLTPHLREFLITYPAIDLRVRVGERLLPEPHSLDIVLHSGWLSDSRLTARKLNNIETILVASKAYVEKHGFLSSIEQLAEHAIIGNFYLDPVAVEPGRLPAYVPPLEIARGTERHRLPFWNRFASTDHTQILEVVQSGLAIAPIAAGRIRKALESGEMIRMLPDYEIVNQPAFYALYTERAAMVPKIQAFLDFTAELIRRERTRPDSPPAVV